MICTTLIINDRHFLLLEAMRCGNDPLRMDQWSAAHVLVHGSIARQLQRHQPRPLTSRGLNSADDPLDGGIEPVPRGRRAAAGGGGDGVTGKAAPVAVGGQTVIVWRWRPVPTPTTVTEQQRTSRRSCNAVDFTDE